MDRHKKASQIRMISLFHALLFAITFANELTAQYKELDFMREEHSTKKNFRLFSCYEYKKCIGYPPPPPQEGQVKKLFSIPVAERLRLLNSAAYDSIVIYSNNQDRITFNSSHEFEKLTNFLFNYYTLRYWDLGIDNRQNVHNENEFSIYFYPSKNPAAFQYLHFHMNGTTETNMENTLLNHLDINLEKMKLIFRKLAH